MMKENCRVLLFLICWLPLIGGAQLIVPEPTPDHPLMVDGLDADNYAFYVEDILTGDILVDHNGDMPFTPASVTKAVTAAAVLSTFSPESRFATVVRTDGYVADSVLHGNIIVECYGDPTTASPYFSDTDISAAIADELVMRGVRRVEGAVMVDISNRIDEGAPPGWQHSDLDKKYGAAHRTCNYGANLFNVSLPAGTTSPLVPDLEVVDCTSRRGAFSFTKSAYANNITLTGKKPRSGGTSAVFPNSSPHLTLAAEVTARLIGRGIGVAAERSEAHFPRTDVLLIHHSPTFAEIMRSMMVRSDNMLAEAMLRTLAPRQSRAEAVRAERRVLEDITEEWDNVTIEDGSGLSRNNRYPAYFLADVLLHMARAGEGIAYVSLFPRAGVEGTVRGLMADTPLRGRLALKSGSMNGVQCYAGYLLDKENFPEKVVIIMVNHYVGDRHPLRKAIENYLTEIFF